LEYSGIHIQSGHILKTRTFYLQIKCIQLPFKKTSTSNGYDGAYNSVTSTSPGVVNKLYLGGTFWLVEFCGEFYFESEGHQEHFQLSYFMQLLMFYYQRFGITDCLLPLTIGLMIRGGCIRDCFPSAREPTRCTANGTRLSLVIRGRVIFRYGEQ
jgi:hypothetical protein